MGLDLNEVTGFYGWIRANALAVIIISIGLLTGYAMYEFIGTFVPAYGTRVATQHAELKRAIASFTALDQILQRELQLFHASRMGLFRMHDGSSDISRMHFFYASAANMVAVPGVTVAFDDVANVPASVFSPVLPAMLDGQVVIMTVDSMPPGPLRELEVKRGSQVSAFAPLSDNDGNLIGFLIVNWLNAADVPTGNDRSQMVMRLQTAATRIAGYFSLDPIRDPDPKTHTDAEH